MSRPSASYLFVYKGKDMKKQHLTYEERCQIYALLKSNFSQAKIAQKLDRSPSTICRELSRNRGRNGYRYKQAQQKANQRQSMRNAKLKKLGPVLQAVVVEKINQKWSPEQVQGWLKNNNKETLSHERIYQFIWENKKRGGKLYLHLRRSGKKYVKRSNGKSLRGSIKNRVGIEQRPLIVDEKKRIGDWELDTIIGHIGKSVLVTMAERVTKFTRIIKTAKKQAHLVANAVVSGLQNYKTKTMTTDNGKEFAYHERITKETGAPVYFARPYHSWERGLNENTNGLVRQYLPKGACFDTVTNEQIQAIEDALNDRPRKMLNFRTPREMMMQAA